DEKFIELAAVQETPADKQCLDFLSIVDIDQRVGPQQNQISLLADFNGPRVFKAEKQGGIAGSGLECLHGRESGLDQQRELIVHAESVIKVRHAAAVSSGQETHADSLRCLRDPQCFLESSFASRHVFRDRYVNNGILFPPVPVLLGYVSPSVILVKG